MIPEFSSRDTIRKLWWLHDSFWHAALVRELGPEKANPFNLEATEKTARMLTNMLLREGVIRRPDNIRQLMEVFKAVWKNAFFNELYIDEPIEYKENRALWVGRRCHAYDSLKRAGLLSGYQCGCHALRNGVMRALRLKPLHSIEESLVKGDGRCVIRLVFVPFTPKPFLSEGSTSSFES